MFKKTLSSSQWLNLFLGSVVVAGGIASYSLGNFDGVSFDELGENYIPKKDVKFSDLPLELQKRYIDKEATLAQSKEENLELEHYVDDFGKKIPEDALTMHDLKRMVARLQKTLLFLHHDNLLMATDKDELMRKLEAQQQVFDEEKKGWMEKSTVRLSEAEEQHFKNISELTLKLNELQKENVLLSQNSNSENNKLKSEILSFERKQQEVLSTHEKELQKVREEEEAKRSPYEKNIATLKAEITQLYEKLRLKEEEHTKQLGEKENQLKERGVALEKEVQKLIEAEEKRQQLIREQKEEIERLKVEYVQQLTKEKEALATKEAEVLKKVTIQEEKQKQLIAELASAKKHIEALMLENEKDFEKFKHYLEEEKKRYDALVATQKEGEEASQKRIQDLEASLTKEMEGSTQKEGKIKALESKVATLEAQTQNFEAEVQKRLEESNKTHNKNYRIFNEKIAHFDRYKQELLLQLDKQLNEYKTTAQENYDRMKHQNEELIRANDTLSLQTQTYEQELKTLKANLALLNQQSDKNQKEEMSKLKEAHVLIVELKESLKEKEKALEALHVKKEETKSTRALEHNNEVAALNSKLAMMEKEQRENEVKLKKLYDEVKEKEALHVKLKEELKQKEMAYLEALNAKENALKKSVAVPSQPAPVTKKSEKLSYVSQITCTDMGTGVNAISRQCHNEVKAFLSQYDTSYFFEVTPIVDNGGFASLKLIKSKKVGVEESEIDRISGLANIGLGKARAKAGGDLVVEQLGEGAKISYALSNIELAKARGFQIKVYR